MTTFIGQRDDKRRRLTAAMLCSSLLTDFEVHHRLLSRMCREQSFHALNHSQFFAISAFVMCPGVLIGGDACKVHTAFSPFRAGTYPIWFIIRTSLRPVLSDYSRLPSSLNNKRRSFRRSSTSFSLAARNAHAKGAHLLDDGRYPRAATIVTACFCTQPLESAAIPVSGTELAANVELVVVTQSACNRNCPFMFVINPLLSAPTLFLASSS